MVFFVDNGRQRALRERADFVLVNLPTFDATAGVAKPMFDLDMRLAELTSFFTVFSFNLPLAELSFATSLDAALSAGNKDFCIIQNCGHIFYGGDTLSTDMMEALDACGFLTGHIMDRGGYFFMHDQCLLVNRRAWERIGRPSFGTPEAGTRTVALPRRSPENVHDNYTPLYLEPTGRDLALKAAFGYGWNAVSESLRHDLPVRNWSDKIRRAKRHCYAYYGDARRWAEALADVTVAEAGDDEMLGMILDFLRNTPSRVDRPNWLFVFNSETDADIPQLKFRRGLDRAFVLASGFKANRIVETLGYSDATEIVVYDYSAPALTLRRLMVEEWDGRDFGGFFMSVRPRIEASFGDPIYYVPDAVVGDAAAIDREFHREIALCFGSLDHWLTHWTRFRALRHSFVQVDVLREPDKVRTMIETHATGHSVIWMSDMFNSPNAIGKFSLAKRKTAFTVLSDTLSACTESRLIIGNEPRLWLRG